MDEIQDEKECGEYGEEVDHRHGDEDDLHEGGEESGVGVQHAER